MTLLALSVLAPLPIFEMASSAANGALKLIWGGVQGLTITSMGGQEPAGQSHLGRLPAQRIKLAERGRREILFDEPVVSATAIDPEVIGAEVTAERRVTLTGLRVGQTILIISGRDIRRTFSVSVSRPAPAVTHSRLNAGAAPAGPSSISGFYNLLYAPSSEDGPSLMRHRFEFRHQMSGDRVVRAAGDFFNFLGGAPGFSPFPGARFGASRFALGVDSKGVRLDVLDSELEFSQRGPAGLAMRGPHLVSEPSSRLRGLELFAGIVRPSSALFDSGESSIAGATVPIAGGPAWRWRAGVFAVNPRAGQLRGGLVGQTHARYAPDAKTLAEVEASYSGGALSWRARLDLRRGAYDIFGETARVDFRSPLAALGGQPGGHTFHSLGARWQPASDLGLFANYSRSASAPPTSSRPVSLDGANVQAGVNYRFTRDSSLGFNFTQQELETPASSVSYLMRLQTRTLTVRHSARFGGRWGNDFEARVILSREAAAGAAMSDGFSVREQLRYSGRAWSAALYARLTRNTPSLESLVVRNPGLLPPALRPSFEADPARFLAANRDALPALLQGIELPLTRSADLGARLQAAFSRYRLTGEARYVSGEILARERRNLAASFGADVRLDNANSVQVSVTRSSAFGTTRNQSAFTLSFTHRFGAASGVGGFSLSKLLGLNRGHIQGRVFFDLNGDGQDDPEEPGAAGLEVQLDVRRGVTTDARGRYRFASLDPGEYSLALLSGRLGVGLRASTATEKRVSLSAHQTATVSFGVTDFGSISGRVLNDLSLTGEGSDSFDAPGVNGVRLVLRPLDAAAGRLMHAESRDPGGTYIFRDLAPGAYRLEIDAATLPADFRPPAQMSWTLKVDPLQTLHLDIQLAAQRAASGAVFIDRDGDGLFDPLKDEAVVGASVTCGKSRTITGSGGSYLLRDLPAGTVEVRARAPWGAQSPPVSVDFGAEPATRRGVNLLVSR